ncbi:MULTISPECIES: KH domain-containing protein [unclassified Gemella]|uniref:KH domain-containing protein n=1 Tax=unclassified Gemella TaxID=2624949 RepID=UPI001C054163|nr:MULTISPECIES: KH domain-containing protein [unclassified Gemella]MBU0279252.1 KH domain-containing protein [Gemella sp. zg-1178]QWQ39030.1 KH domain-containing protein [Gemella sp. zg-570]
MEELIYNIVSEIVEHKEEIKIEKFIKNAREHYVLSVHPDDCGRIIGKKGMTINAIRTVLNSTNFTKKVYFNIAE